MKLQELKREDNWFGVNRKLGSSSCFLFCFTNLAVIEKSSCSPDTLGYESMEIHVGCHLLVTINSMMWTRALYFSEANFSAPLPENLTPDSRKCSFHRNASGIWKLSVAKKKGGWAWSHVNVTRICFLEKVNQVTHAEGMMYSDAEKHILIQSSSFVLVVLGLHCYMRAFLSLQWAGATLRCGVGFSSQCLLSCCGSQALEQRLISCSTWA